MDTKSIINLNSFNAGDDWVSVENALPSWYVPVLVLHDGNPNTNPFSDKIRIDQRHHLAARAWNNYFSLDAKVLYWRYIPNVPDCDFSGK